MKIAVNRNYGGFDLSDEAFEVFLNLKGIQFDKVEDEKPMFAWKDESRKQYDFYEKGAKRKLVYGRFLKYRTDPDLITAIEQLGDKANGLFADIEILEIPEDTKWRIDEHDGLEWVSEGRRWPALLDEDEWFLNEGNK